MPKTKTLSTKNNTNDITDSRPAMKKPTKKRIVTTVDSIKPNTTRHGSSIKRK